MEEFYKLTDILEIYGKDDTQKLLNTFHNDKDSNIEDYLINKAIMHELNKNTATYLLLHKDFYVVKAYFSLSLKIMNLELVSEKKTSYKR